MSATAWTDEEKENVAARYKEEMAKFETDAIRADKTVEVCDMLAKEFDRTTNGIRRILNDLGVYIKKAPKTAAKKEGSTSARINKAEAHADLIAAIQAIEGASVDKDIIDKLTGKAAVYLTAVLTAKVSSDA